MNKSAKHAFWAPCFLSTLAWMCGNLHSSSARPVILRSLPLKCHAENFLDDSAPRLTMGRNKKHSKSYWRQTKIIVNLRSYNRIRVPLQHLANTVSCMQLGYMTRKMPVCKFASFHPWEQIKKQAPCLQARNDKPLQVLL